MADVSATGLVVASAVKSASDKEAARNDPRWRHDVKDESCPSRKRCRREGIRMRTLFVTLLTAILGLFVGYVLFELAAILLSGHTAEAGVGRILIRLAFVCGGIALLVAVLRRRSR